MIVYKGMITAVRAISCARTHNIIICTTGIRQVFSNISRITVQLLARVPIPRPSSVVTVSGATKHPSHPPRHSIPGTITVEHASLLSASGGVDTLRSPLARRRVHHPFITPIWPNSLHSPDTLDTFRMRFPLGRAKHTLNVFHSLHQVAFVCAYRSIEPKSMRFRYGLCLHASVYQIRY